MTVNLRDLRTITSFLGECEKFEFIEGVPTLTVSPDLMSVVRDAIAAENLCRIGLTAPKWTDYEKVSVFGVVMKTSYGEDDEGGRS